MLFKTRKNSRTKHSGRARHPRFEPLETRKLLDADPLEVSVEIDPKEQVPEDVTWEVVSWDDTSAEFEKVAMSYMVDAEVSADDTIAFQAFETTVLDGSEEWKVPEDGEPNDDLPVVFLRTLADLDGVDGALEKSDELAEPVLFTMFSMEEFNPEEVRFEEGDPNVVFYSMGEVAFEEFGIDDVSVFEELEEGDPNVVFYSMGNEMPECFGAEVNLSFVEVPWHNGLNPHDVNGDGYTSPLDVLTMINWINDRGIGVPEDETLGDESLAEAESANSYPDIDGDGMVAPMDVLLLINQLSNQEANGGVFMEAVALTIPDAASDCLDPASGTRLANPEDWTESDVSGDEIFGIDVGEYLPPDPDEARRVADAVFEEFDVSSDQDLEEALLLELK